MSPDISKCPLVGKLPPVENHGGIITAKTLNMQECVQSSKQLHKEDITILHILQIKIHA